MYKLKYLSLALLISLPGCADFDIVQTVTDATVNAVGLDKASLKETPSCLAVDNNSAIKVMSSSKYDIAYAYDNRTNLACCLVKTKKGSTAPILSDLCLKKHYGHTTWRVVHGLHGKEPVFDKNKRFNTKKQAYNYAAEILANS